MVKHTQIIRRQLALKGLINPFMHIIEKWPGNLVKIAIFLKYVWPF